MTRRDESNAHGEPGTLTKLPRWASALGVSALVVALLLPRACERQRLVDTGTAAHAAIADLPAPTALQGAALDRFADVAAAATPAVVRIESRALGATSTQRPVPEMFQPFFGPDAGPPQPRPRIAGGSGFIISPDGHIVTNAHVVAGGGDLTVWLNDRRSFDARLVGLDRTTDVAVIDIDAEGLPTLPLSDATDLRVGNWVLAIGSPGVGGGQLEQTVTAGIVSAFGRSLQLLGRGLMEDPETQEFAGYAIENFIQTDAVINPGNSGGPLIDMNGRVIGVNTAIASPTGYYLGYGFAVPSQLASSVAGDLIEFGEVRRARLGVSVTTVAPEDADFFGLSEVRGVLVQEVGPGTPAAEAGLRQGDVIVSLDGEEINRSGDLQLEVARRTPGETVEIGLIRDGEPMTVSARLGETDLPRSGAPSPATEDATTRLGLRLGPLTATTRSELGYDAAIEGPVVVEVVPLSPAHQRGIPAGSVILEVDGQPVSSPEQTADRIAEAEPGDVVGLLVAMPGGVERLITVRLPS